MDFDTSYFFDERLREVPHHPDQMRAAVEAMQLELSREDVDDERRLQLLGQMGAFMRILGDLVTAQMLLEEAISLSEALGILPIANRLRLAHVHQWAGQFALADAIFGEIIAQCEADRRLEKYLDFAYQHAAKSAFEQGRYQEAKVGFENALALRLHKGDTALLQSTQDALTILQNYLESS